MEATGQQSAALEPDPRPGVGAEAGPEAGSPEEFAQRDRETLAGLPLVFRVLDSTLRTVMVLVLVVLIVSVGVNVFGRFVLDRSLAVSDELARLLFVWVIFLGAALAHLHREHIMVDTLVQRLSGTALRVVTVVQELLVLVLMGALLVGAREVMSTSPGNTPLLDVPYNLFTVAVPVAAIVIALITAYRIALALRPAPARAGQEG